MSHSESVKPAVATPLRLWPGVLAALLLVLGRFVLPVVMPGAALFGVIGGVVGGLAIVAWWLFSSRAALSERWGAIVLMIVALLATSRVVDESIRTGMMGMLLVIYAVPVLSLALVGSAVVSRYLWPGRRRASMVAAILLGCSVFALLRTSGMSGEGLAELHWRWAESPEERLLAREGDKPAALPPALAAPETPKEEAPVAAKALEEPLEVLPRDDEPAALPLAASASKKGADWPGFRGPERDGIVRGVRIGTDWAASPPVELWRRPIGPGWSSFAVRGPMVYTQEQRGDDEVVSAYSLTTGDTVWRHSDPVRFWESNAGAGPRATPTVANGRVYAFGATGILNALDAGNGAVIWSRKVAEETNTVVPDWGFSSSPLVVGDVVIVAVSGTLTAYDARTGSPRWSGAARRGSYSSPHLSTIDGVAQILLLSDSGASSVAPATGAVLWEHQWPGGTTIVQPAIISDSDILINNIGLTGGPTRRLAVAHGAGAWSVHERWTSNGLKPYFNDFVVHKGHAFGFDGSILACIDLEDGKRAWKGGRYGNGQLVLLPDEDVLLVLSEEGELALVKATPDQFTEVARFPALQGKTWNHPVLVGDILLVRNGEEMAAFRLPLANR